MGILIIIDFDIRYYLFIFTRVLVKNQNLVGYQIFLDGLFFMNYKV